MAIIEREESMTTQLTGISVDRDCTTNLQQLKNGGIMFVGRYYSRGANRKNIKATEAQAISRESMAIVAVYENAPTRPSYFSFASGHNDGVDAYHYANQVIHQPFGSAIYFAVDFDAPASVIAGSVKDYFEGVAKGFGDAANGNPVYDIGVYGSGATCAWLLANSRWVKYSWLAESTGWTGSQSFSGWSIKQSLIPRGTTIGGFDENDAESDVAVDKYGAFLVLV
jgi:hypothetical protein